MAKAKVKPVIEEEPKQEVTKAEETQQQLAPKDDFITVKKVFCDDKPSGYEIQIKGVQTYTVSDDQTNFKGVRLGSFEDVTKKKSTEKVLIDSLPSPK